MGKDESNCVQTRCVPGTSSGCGGEVHPLLLSNLPDVREVMVVVFRDEVQVVHQRHRRLEPRVQNGSMEHDDVQSAHTLQQLLPAGAKFSQNRFEATAVVVRFVGCSILQVGRG